MQSGIRDTDGITIAMHTLQAYSNGERHMEISLSPSHRASDQPLSSWYQIGFSPGDVTE
jgi:hypothetical protein